MAFRSACNLILSFFRDSSASMALSVSMTVQGFVLGSSGSRTIGILLEEGLEEEEVGL